MYNICLYTCIYPLSMVIWGVVHYCFTHIIYTNISYTYIYIHIGSMQYSGYLAATKFVMIVRVISCYLVFQHC